MSLVPKLLVPGSMYLPPKRMAERRQAVVLPATEFDIDLEGANYVLSRKCLFLLLLKPTGGLEPLETYIRSYGLPSLLQGDGQNLS